MTDEATDIGARYRLDAIERRLDTLDRIVASHARQIESLEHAAKAGEVRDESNARRIEEVAEKTAQRFDQFRAELDHILETAAGRRSKNEETLAALAALVEQQSVALESLRIEFKRHVAHARKMSTGPKSYDKRIERLERLIGLCAPAFPPDKEAFDKRVAALEKAVANLTERDPLRRAQTVYSGLGDDTTAANAGDAPDNLMSRDMDTAVRAILIPLANVLRSNGYEVIRR